MYHTHITQYLDETVALHPDRIAVRDGERKMTFRELYERILAEAQGISKKLGGRTKQIVGVFLPKSIEAVISDIAILYSGNAYMNLDVKNPNQRICSILGQTRPSLLIVGNDTGQFGDEMPVYSLKDSTLSLENKEKILAIRKQCIDTDLLCLINTSGSTGIPKAVALNHRNFIDFTEAVRDAALAGENEIVGSLSPAVFDIFSFELCMMMAYGSSIVILPESFAAFPARLLELLQKYDVSFIFWVPTIMVNIANLELLGQIHLPALKTIWFAGEVFPTAKFNYWRRQLPRATFANFYGPIEITLDCLYYVADKTLPDDMPIPIGRPFRNTEVMVLDDDNKLIDSGKPSTEGELCVRGSSLAMGYYNNPEKTSAAFTQNPLNTAYPEIIYRTGDIVVWNENGDLVFRGRKDTLIKHAGYRIELGEIEHVAIATGLVANCCAMYDSVTKKIVFAYEATTPLPEKTLRQTLGNILPRYMVPGVYRHLESMPRNANGKIDRLLLKRECLDS